VASVRRPFVAFVAFVSFVVTVAIAGAQSAPSVPLGRGRPETPGITRTTLKDDAKSTVTRVHFAPGAVEPPHTHPYDVILVPVTSGPVDFAVADKKATVLKAGEVQFVPKDTTHHLGNSGKQPFELIAIAIK
jgi:quercetin dioxygenase-like cupin family protein